ncbi:hypothetical protein STENM36S_06132 [Streptomyces tendae]
MSNLDAEKGLLGMQADFAYQCIRGEQVQA